MNLANRLRHFASGALQRPSALRIRFVSSRLHTALLDARRIGAVEDLPFRHEAWLERAAGRRRQSPLPVEHASGESSPGTKLVVLVHVHYPDLLPEILGSLANIPVEHDVVVTNSSGAPLTIERLPPLTGRTIVVSVENRGRDILPLVRVINEGILDPYELVLKIHTKRSPWRAGHAQLDGDGDGWRTRLIDNLVGTSEGVGRILDLFDTDPTIGLLTGAGSVLGTEYWGSNQRNVSELLKRLELALPTDDLVFAAGSMYWCRAFLLQGLRALQFTPADFEPETGQTDGTAAHAIERLLGLLTAEAGYRTVGSDIRSTESQGRYGGYEASAPRSRRARILPFYLPQFHPFEENNQWWGEGFTEWSNVTAAAPAFAGHRQPLLPGELGYYDLRTEGVRARQYALAEENGIEGFMYYTYWFAGRRLMRMPIEDLVESNDGHSFCVMWANENWTRAWDGGVNDVLIAQDYEAMGADKFVDDVMPLLRDPRYVTVHGMPVLAVYRPALIPDMHGVIQAWRASAAREGLPGLILLSVEVDRSFGAVGDPVATGFDGSLGFPPHAVKTPRIRRPTAAVDRRFAGIFFDYRATANAAIASLESGLAGPRFPGVMVNFDNTARRQWDAHVFVGSNPYTYHRWLRAAVQSVERRPEEERMVFVNAWNEWAEGAVLEPTASFGSTYLLATRAAAGGAKR